MSSEIDDLVMVALESGDRYPKQIADRTELNLRTVQVTITRLMQAERIHRVGLGYAPGRPSHVEHSDDAA